MNNNRFISFVAVVFSVAMAFSLAARADMPVNKNAIEANISNTMGGIAFGVDFERGYNNSFAVGGYLRVIPESSNNGYPQNGITAIGAFIRPHFSRQQWDFYVSPGFGINMVEPYAQNVSNQTYLGPTMSLGLIYEMSPTFAFGAEETFYYDWLGGKQNYQGYVFNDLSAKFRFIF